ncbi:hypothetical protein [Actinomycetospora termitidis]|uniref:Holin n=1 Tax=Actinomycetospora termitidis TaxID=3053470 RepID=A0ABT7MGU0_9PSEU|nr:hypothetical protein [Actinomycetospora sp. Odt1-22]MDL5159389.1 hypothetical protein [Actinomycetospora sp. Odt1-22]
MSDVSRPKPITDAVKVVGSGISGVLGVVQTLVVLGVLNSQQAEAINELGYATSGALPVLADATSTIVAVVAGLITIGTGVAASFGVAKTAEPKVTPLESPRNADGVPLITSAAPGTYQG